MRYGLRVRELAERKGVSVSLINKLAMRPDFPPVETRVGRATFYDAETFDFYWATRKDGRSLNGRKRKR